MGNLQSDFHYLVKRFLEGTASPAEREEVCRLLETDVIDEIMQKELYRLQRKNLDAPFGLYKTKGNFAALSPILEQDRIPKEGMKKYSSEEEIIEEIIHFRVRDEDVRRRIYGAALAIASVIILVTIGLFTFWPGRDHTGSTDFALGHESVLLNTKQCRVLPDGSIVYVNSHSALCYQKNGVREVTLSGEAYFDVAHDSLAPFIINVEGIEVKVFGTAFNVRVDSAHHAVVVTVARGLVAVGRGDEVFGLVRPMEELTVDFHAYSHEIKTISLDTDIEWFRREGLLDRTTRDSVSGFNDIIVPSGSIRLVDGVAARIYQMWLGTNKNNK